MQEEQERRRRIQEERTRMQMEKKEEMKRSQQQVIVKKTNTKFKPAGFFAKSLIANQIRLFRLFQTFRLFSTYPTFRHPAQCSSTTERQIPGAEQPTQVGQIG